MEKEVFEVELIFQDAFESGLMATFIFKYIDMIFFKTIISFIKDRAYRDLLITSSFILVIGSVVYHYLEGWSWIDSLYFSVITLTTIGYGDFSPVTDGGKLFTIIYIIIGLGMILNFIHAIYNHYAESKSWKA